MTKRYCVIIIVCFFMSTIAFCGLWLGAKYDKSEILLLAQEGANDAFIQFTQYQQTGDESYYWAGVASFRSFEQAYYLIVEGTNKTTNYIFCNEVYGSLVHAPERSRNHIAEIVAVMEALSYDVRDENAYLLMENLRNSLQQ